jgi:hypothetical protein
MAFKQIEKVLELRKIIMLSKKKITLEHRR